MTVQELHEQLSVLMQQQPRVAQHELFVYTDDAGLVGFNVAKVSGVYNGFDWYNGKLLIHTENKLVTKKQKS